MTTKQLNILGIVLIVIETALQAIGAIDLNPIVQQWMIVGLATLGFIANGIKLNFTKMNAIFWVNIIAFGLYLSGGIADLLNVIPNMDASIKTSILKASGVVYALLNITLKSIANRKEKEG